ncbi:MAG: hypothetical protein WCP39_07965, partial [Chlamydiota bacterium]
KYGLELLEKCNQIDEIIILTNTENDEKLKKTGFKTIMQDDKIVFDILTGFQFIKSKIISKKGSSNQKLRKIIIGVSKTLWTIKSTGTSTS